MVSDTLSRKSLFLFRLISIDKNSELLRAGATALVAITIGSFKGSLVTRPRFII